MTTPAQRARYRATGRCVNCGRALDRTGTHCERCMQTRRETRKRRYTRLKETRRCVRCLGTPEKGYVYCRVCRRRAKAAKHGTANQAVRRSV